MRIASNFFLAFHARMGAALVIALGAFCFAPTHPYAADIARPASGSPSIAAADSPSVSVPVTAVSQAPVAAGIPIAAAAAPNESIRKNLSTMEDEVSANAKKVIKRLDTPSDTTSLADMNSARQTVTRIEAMIEIEKRLKELEKIRGESNGISSAPAVLASAIPQSALTPMMVPPPSETDIPRIKMSSFSPHPEISHIYGTGGKYTAVLKLSDGDLKPVRVGDKLSDNETIRAITSSTVEVGGKTTYSLRVKNVDMVYSAMR